MPVLIFVFAVATLYFSIFCTLSLLSELQINKQIRNTYPVKIPSSAYRSIQVRRSFIISKLHFFFLLLYIIIIIYKSLFFFFRSPLFFFFVSAVLLKGGSSV